MKFKMVGSTCGRVVPEESISMITGCNTGTVGKVVVSQAVSHKTYPHSGGYMCV